MMIGTLDKEEYIYVMSDPKKTGGVEEVTRGDLGEGTYCYWVQRAGKTKLVDMGQCEEKQPVTRSRRS